MKEIRGRHLPIYSIDDPAFIDVPCPDKAAIELRSRHLYFLYSVFEHYDIFKSPVMIHPKDVQVDLSDPTAPVVVVQNHEVQQELKTFLEGIGYKVYDAMSKPQGPLPNLVSLEEWHREVVKEIDNEQRSGSEGSKES